LLGKQVESSGISRWSQSYGYSSVGGRSVYDPDGDDSTTPTAAVTPSSWGCSNAGETTRFTFAVWNAFSDHRPQGAFRSTSDRYPDMTNYVYTNYISYWKASCKIADWDTGSSACHQDFTAPDFAMARRSPHFSSNHGAIQGYNAQSAGQPPLSLTGFQSSPAVGYFNRKANFASGSYMATTTASQVGAVEGSYGGYSHNIGFCMWFR